MEEIFFALKLYIGFLLWNQQDFSLGNNKINAIFFQNDIGKKKNTKYEINLT